MTTTKKNYTFIDMLSRIIKNNSFFLTVQGEIDQLNDRLTTVEQQLESAGIS